MSPQGRVVPSKEGGERELAERVGTNAGASPVVRGPRPQLLKDRVAAVAQREV